MIIYKVYYYLKMENKKNFKKYTKRKNFIYLIFSITIIYQSIKLVDYMEQQKNLKEIEKIKKKI